MNEHIHCADAAADSLNVLHQHDAFFLEFGLYLIQNVLERGIFVIGKHTGLVAVWVGDL